MRDTSQGRAGQVLPAQSPNPPIAAPDLQGYEIQNGVEDRLGGRFGRRMIRDIMLLIHLGDARRRIDEAIFV